MSFKKFLGATSIVALLAAGSAQALDLTGATVTLANELDFSTAKRGVLDLTIATNDDLPQANGYRLTVTLTGDLQFRGLTGGAVSTAAPGVGGSVISSGGADGSQSVVILFNTVNATVGDTLAINLRPQIQVVGTNGGTVSITLTDPNGSTIEGGSAVLRDAAVAAGGAAIPAIGYRSGFNLSVAADALDSKLAAPTYNSFVVGGADTATTAVLADLSLTVDTRAQKSNGAAFVPVALADVTGYRIVSNFESNTGIPAANGVSYPATAGFGAANATRSGTTYTATVTGTPTDPALVAPPGGSATAVVGTKVLTKTVGASIVPQRPTVSELTLNFDAANGYKASEAGTISSIDVIDLQGESEGPFKWVGDAAAPTGNVFRVTGLKGTAVPRIFVTIRNSTNNVDGVYQMPTAGKVISGNAVTGASELVLTNADVQNAVGAPFGRADVTFTFGDGTDGTGNAINVDRLLSAGGVISAFGDTQNQ